MSTLGNYVGARVMSNWTVSLNVYGAESSPDFGEEEFYEGSFCECAKKLKQYGDKIKEKGLDAYLSLSAMSYDCEYTGDYERIIASLEEDGLL